MVYSYGTSVIDFMCSSVSRSEGHRDSVSAEEELQNRIERLSGHWYPHYEEEGSVFFFVTDVKNPLSSGMLLIVLQHVWCEMIDANILYFNLEINEKSMFRKDSLTCQKYKKLPK